VQIANYQALNCLILCSLPLLPVYCAIGSSISQLCRNARLLMLVRTDCVLCCRSLLAFYSTRAN